MSHQDTKAPSALAQPANKLDDLDDIAKSIVNCAFLVHKTLGPGLLESYYEEALCYELEQRGLEYESQKPVPVPYKDIFLNGQFRLDLIVENQIIIELKCVEKLNDMHTAQILTYMKLANARLGFLINFNTALIKNGIKRFVL